jgi:hypothetical protein
MAWPLGVQAQPSGKTYRIGFLGVFSYEDPQTGRQCPLDSEQFRSAPRTG